MNILRKVERAKRSETFRIYYGLMPYPCKTRIEVLFFCYLFHIFRAQNYSSTGFPLSNKEVEELLCIPKNTQYRMIRRFKEIGILSTSRKGKHGMRLFSMNVPKITEIFKNRKVPNFDCEDGE